MINTLSATRGMVTAPHHLAAQSGLDVLRAGGNAIEAMVAAAATIAVVYPHMNSIGGDGFWLIHHPDGAPIAIDACGAAGAAVTRELYNEQALQSIPTRGPMAANTVAGTISGWHKALDVSRSWGGTLALPRLLEEAIFHAENGIAVTAGQESLTNDKLAELQAVHGFADAFLVAGVAPKAASLLKNPRLGQTFRRLAGAGLDDFYRGKLAQQISADLARAGSPINGADLAGHTAALVTPLKTALGVGSIYNLPPPTQGIASLMILALFDRLRLGEHQAETFDYVHSLVEATKQAFRVRDRDVTDPKFMQTSTAALLESAHLDRLSQNIDSRRAAPWPHPAQPGDTIWMGAVDSEGRAVSFIQSIYWEFGSGVVLDESGIHWQNRGASFSLDRQAKDALEPGRKPFHTLNPALAQFNDGRVMPYGTMGGEGQPQTQAAVFSRYAHFHQPLQQAISAPRWLLGRTWGEESTNLKLESRFDPGIVEQLRSAGHDVQVIEPFSSTMGHAGAIVRHPNGVIEGGADPRSDGSAAGY